MFLDNVRLVRERFLVDFAHEILTDFHWGSKTILKLFNNLTNIIENSWEIRKVRKIYILLGLGKGGSFTTNFHFHGKVLTFSLTIFCGKIFIYFDFWLFSKGYWRIEIFCEFDIDIWDKDKNSGH